MRQRAAENFSIQHAWQAEDGGHIRSAPSPFPALRDEGSSGRCCGTMLCRHATSLLGDGLNCARQINAQKMLLIGSRTLTIGFNLSFCDRGVARRGAAMLRRFPHRAKRLRPAAAAWAYQSAALRTRLKSLICRPSISAATAMPSAGQSCAARVVTLTYVDRQPGRSRNLEFGNELIIVQRRLVIADENVFDRVLHARRPA